VVEVEEESMPLILFLYLRAQTTQSLLVMAVMEGTVPEVMSLAPAARKASSLMKLKILFML
jgi:hypothetical protein